MSLGTYGKLICRTFRSRDQPSNPGFFKKLSAFGFWVQAHGSIRVQERQPNLALDNNGKRYFIFRAVTM